MSTVWFKLILLVMSTFLLTLMAPLKPAHAQWPPFSFDMIPTHENGKIIYTIEFTKKADDALTDVVFKIPLPQGTRFLEANAQPTTSINFDGAEITFFTATLHRPIRNASFTVEIIDPDQTIFTTQAWVGWKGDLPGDYLMDEIILDLNQQPLDWTRPESRLTIEAKATIVDEVITYIFYPRKQTNRRMWDLRISVPVPEGTTFLSAEAPPPFVIDFDGREVSFLNIETDRHRDVGPLIVKVFADDITDPFIITHAWATWKNVGRSVGRSVVFQEEARSGDIVVQPHTNQQIAADPIGDTPFAYYDLTSIALQKTGSALQVNFYTSAEIGPVGEPLDYIVYIDTDCNTETGGKRGNRGAEYWIRYNHENGEAYIYNWSEAEDQWVDRRLIESDGPTGKMVRLSVPNEYLDTDPQFCWLGRVWNRSKAHTPNPPNEWVGNDPRITQFESLPGALIEMSSILPTNENQPWGVESPETAFSLVDIPEQLPVP